MTNVYLKDLEGFQRVPSEEIVTINLPTLGYQPDSKVLEAVEDTMPDTKVVVINHNKIEE